MQLMLGVVAMGKSNGGVETIWTWKGRFVPGSNWKVRHENGPLKSTVSYDVDGNEASLNHTPIPSKCDFFRFARAFASVEDALSSEDEPEGCADGFGPCGRDEVEAGLNLALERLAQEDLGISAVERSVLDVAES